MHTRAKEPEMQEEDFSIERSPGGRESGLDQATMMEARPETSEPMRGRFYSISRRVFGDSPPAFTVHFAKTKPLGCVASVSGQSSRLTALECYHADFILPMSTSPAPPRYFPMRHTGLSYTGKAD